MHIFISVKHFSLLVIKKKSCIECPSSESLERKWLIAALNSGMGLPPEHNNVPPKDLEFHPN